MEQKAFSPFWVYNYLKGCSPSSVLVVTGKLLWSQRAATTSASLSIWVGLGQTLRNMGMQPSLTVPACSSVWPVYFFILACAEFVLMLQLDNFPIDLWWCEREQQHFPISAGKSHGHSSGESSLAVTLLRSSKGKSRFSFSPQHSAFLSSLALDGVDGISLSSAPTHLQAAQEQLQVPDLPVAFL